MAAQHARPDFEAEALREDWLSQLARSMEAIMADRAGISFPPYRVTCGFPSKGGELGKKTRVRGQCWSAAASDDQHAEIFISPRGGRPGDRRGDPRP